MAPTAAAVTTIRPIPRRIKKATGILCVVHPNGRASAAAVHEPSALCRLRAPLGEADGSLAVHHASTN
jgi:hypothetical protein